MPSSFSNDYLEVAHAIPGRLRARVPRLRGRADALADAARVVAAIHGVIEVRVHPFAGSLLVFHDERRIDQERLIEALREAAGARSVVRRGEPRPRQDPQVPAPPSAVGRAVAEVCRDLNQDLLRVSGGGLDLGVLVTAAFIAFGAGEVAAMKKLQPPPWFNLAWWGVQNFRASESEALRRERGAPGGPSETAPA